MSTAISVTASDRLAWSYGEVAKLIGSSERFLRNEAKRGRLRVVRRGRRVFIPASSLHAYLNAEQPKPKSLRRGAIDVGVEASTTA